MTEIMERAVVTVCLQVDRAEHEISSSWELSNFLLHRDEPLLSFSRLLFSVVCRVSSLRALCRLPSVPVSRGGLSTPSPYAAALLFEVLVSRALDTNFLIKPPSFDLTTLASKKNKKKKCDGCLSADSVSGIARPMGGKFASFFSEHLHFRKS